jgi:hypothetical protein
MHNRFFVSLSAVSLVMAAIVWAPVPVVAQQAPSGANSKLAASVWDPTAPPPSGWTAPRTSWGDPDLQGFWLVLSYTPLERPAALAGKPLYTKEEAVDAFKKAVALDAEVDPTTIHYDWKEYGMDAWQSPVRPNRRTSLIVDPPDGRIPPRTPEAQKRRALGCCGVGGTDVQSVGWYTRCLLGVEAAPRVPGGVTTESQIVQAPGYVMWIQESNNDVRIIPVDGRPHLPSNVKQYLGDARGHWEGNTLVVETTNFTDETKWQGSTAGMRLVERFTLADAKTLKYEFTVTDPATWTKPWTMEAPLPRIDPPLYEFACHEQNYGVINVVKGAQIRAAEGIGLSGRAPDYTSGDGK